MKRKLPLLLVVLMLLSMAYMPAAYAAPSAERNDDEINIDDDDVSLIELPTVDIAAEVTVDQNGTAAVIVDAEKILEAVGSVISGDAVRIMVTATAASNPANDGAAVKAVSAAMPKEALKTVVDQTDAEMDVITDVGRIILPNAAIASIVERAGGEDVTFSMDQKTVDFGRDLLQEALGTSMDISEARIQGGSVTEIDIFSGGKNITSWEGGAISLDLPIGSGQFELGKGYRVIQISADKSETEHTGRCVMDDMGLHVEISITHLSTFLVLAEAVEEDMGTAPVPMIASPLAAVGNGGNSSGGSSMIYILVGLVLVAGAAGGVMLMRRQDSETR